MTRPARCMYDDTVSPYVRISYLDNDFSGQDGWNGSLGIDHHFTIPSFPTWDPSPRGALLADLLPPLPADGAAATKNHYRV